MQAGAATGFVAAFTEAPIDFYKSQIQVQVIRSQSDPNYKRMPPAPASQDILARLLLHKVFCWRCCKRGLIGKLRLCLGPSLQPSKSVLLSQCPRAAAFIKVGECVKQTIRLNGIKAPFQVRRPPPPLLLRNPEKCHPLLHLARNGQLDSVPLMPVARLLLCSPYLNSLRC